jgi:hypothetical protein
MGPDIVFYWAITAIIYLIIGVIVAEMWASESSLTSIDKGFVTLLWGPIVLLTVIATAM